MKSLPHKTAIFLHLGKTGGTSIREMFLHSDTLNVVDYNRGIDFIKSCKADPDFLPDTLSRRDVVMGHFGFVNDILSEVRGNIVLLSVIRDPIPRIISNFKYIKRTPKHPIYDELTDLSFDEAWRTHRRFRHLSSNTQLRVLCNGKTPADFFHAAENYDFVVGTHDHLDRFRLAVENVLGVALPDLKWLKKTPATQEDPEISSRVMQQVEVANAQDRGLVDIINRDHSGVFVSGRLTGG